jgi:hypothetical protein
VAGVKCYDDAGGEDLGRATGTAKRCACERSKWLCEAYAVRRVQRPPARDQMVIGVSPATSSAEASSGMANAAATGTNPHGEEGEKTATAHRALQVCLSGLGEARRRRNRRRRRGG